MRTQYSTNAITSERTLTPVHTAARHPTWMLQKSIRLARSAQIDGTSTSADRTAATEERFSRIMVRDYGPRVKTASSCFGHHRVNIRSDHRRRGDDADHAEPPRRGRSQSHLDGSVDFPIAAE